MSETGDRLNFALNKVNTDPEFATFSYEKQQRIRAKVTGMILSQDQNFAVRPADSKVNIVSSIVGSQKPVFSSQEIGQTIMPLLEKADNGTITESEINALNMNNGLFNSSLLSNVTVRPAAKLADAIVGIFKPDAISWENLLNSATGKDGDKAVSYINDKLYKKSKEQAQSGTVTSVGDDGKSVNNFKTLAKRGKGANLTGNILGFIADFAVFHGAWENISAGTVKVAGNAIAANTVGGFGTFAGKVALPTFASGTASGLYGVTKESLLAVINDDNERQQNTFAKVAKTFGSYALLDYALGLAVGTAVHVKTFKHLMAKAPDAFKAYTPEEVNKLINQAVDGEVPPEIFNQLPPDVGDYILGQTAIRRAAGNIDDAVRLRPYDDLVLSGNSAGMTVYQNPETGLYKVFSVTSRGEVAIDQFDSIVGAKRKVSDGLFKRLDSLEGPEKELFFNKHKNMLQYKLSENIIDGSLDPLKVKKVVSSDAKKVLVEGKRAKKFVSPVDRPYVGITEVEKYEKVFGQEGFTKRMKTAIPEDVLDGVAKGDDLYKGTGPVSITEDAAADSSVLVMLRNPANKAAYDEAASVAEKAIKAGSGGDKDGLIKMYLMEAGFDGVVYNPSKVDVFYANKIKLVAERFDPYTGKIGDLTDLSKIPEKVQIDNIIQRQYTATVGAKSFNQNKELISKTAASFSGDLNESDVRNFSKMILAEKGIDPSKVTIRMSRGVNAIDSAKDQMAYARISKANGTVDIEIPRTITTPKAQKKFLDELFGELNNAVATLGEGAKAVKFTGVAKKAVSQFKSPFSSAKATELWLKSGVEDIMKGSFSKTANGYSVKLPGGKSFSAGTLDDIADKVLVETMPKEYLRFDLAKQGYKMSSTKDGLIVRGKGLAEPVTGKSVNEILDKLDYRPDKISSKFAPKITVINPDSVTVAFDNGVALGPKKALKNLLNQFEDMDTVAQLKKIGGYENGDVFIAPSGQYEVHMPEIGLIQKFDSAQAANKFVRKQWKEYSSLQDIAARKGLNMWHDGAVTKVSDGKEVYSAKNRQELYSVFKQYPDSTAAPELAVSDPDALSALDKVLLSYDDAKIPLHDAGPISPIGDISSPVEGNIDTLNARQELRALVENMDWWTEKTMKELGKPELLNQYRSVETARRITQLEIDKTDKAIMAVFTGEDGKLLSVDRRKAIFFHEGAQTVDEEMNAVELFGELTTREKSMANNLRQLLGTLEDGTHVTGLAGKFGVDSDQFLHKYMPRIMDYAVRNQAELAKMVTAEDLFTAALSKNDSKIPKKLGAFFKNMRASEVLTFRAIDDPLQALQHYNRIGHKQLYMGRAWEDLYTGLRNAGVGEGVYLRFNRYRESLMGMQITSGEKTAKRIGEAVGKKLGMKNGSDLMSAYFSVNYLANMGFRPWLAVRNTTQVWTTLAPRFGNYWVDQGIKRTTEMGETGYNYLRKIGLIADAPPIVNTIMDADTLLGKVTHRALKMFKNSDDITRAVAYNTGIVRFESSLAKMRKGVVKGVDDFLVDSGVSKMDDDTVREIKRLLEAGTDDSLEAAKAKFGMKISDDTMFGYRSSQSPGAFTGSLWGKVIGQYGTYSAGYRANILRGLSYGSTGDKAAFAARFLGNQTALFAGFTALGVNAKNFIPGAPALFGGGPQFEVGIALVQSFGSSFQAKQARAQLMRKFSPVYYTQSKGARLNYPEMLPGSLQLRYAQKSLEYLDQGDYWKAFLAATTTPVVSE